MLTAGFWRSRRAAAVAGILFGLLLIVAPIMVGVAPSEQISAIEDRLLSAVVSSGLLFLAMLFGGAGYLSQLDGDPCRPDGT